MIITAVCEGGQVGPRAARLLVYCADYRCCHLLAISGHGWPDNLRVSDPEARFVCRACGKKQPLDRDDGLSLIRFPRITSQELVQKMDGSSDQPLSVSKSGRTSAPLGLEPMQLPRRCVSEEDQNGGAQDEFGASRTTPGVATPSLPLLDVLNKPLEATFVVI